MWFFQPGITFQTLVIRILAILFVVFLILPFHEYAHAWVAYKLGDNTAKNMGRLTFNPLVHFSPLGAACILLFNFGWANPVPIDSRNFKNPKRDMALTALAGPASNLFAAVLGGLFLNLTSFLGYNQLRLNANMFFYYYISINISLAVFNLIPLPPLDGFRIMEAFIPQKLMLAYYKNSRIIIWIIFFLLLFGFFNVPLTFMERVLYNFVIKITSIF